jgi:hypothetical protein
MKLGKMLSVGEVVEYPVPEETTVAKPAPAATVAESATQSADSGATPVPAQRLPLR